MTLDKKLREQRKVVIRRTPPENVMEQVGQGKRFIVVGNDFSHEHIPFGYMLIDMKYRNESFKTLVPQNLLFFLANPGEGDVDDALDEIADFYDNVRDFEDDLLEENGDSVQGTNWAVTARSAYCTYLINKLTKSNEDDSDIPEWNEETLNSLCLDDDYIEKRVKAMAAVCLEKTAEQVRNYGLGDVLKHITVNERKVEQLTREEFDRVACYAGSHYEIKEEFRNNPNVEYRIERHNQAGTKITKKRDVPVLDARIDDLEREIEQRRLENKGDVGRHDKMLTRMYANLRYIAKENSGKQLEIMPDDGVQK